MHLHWYIYGDLCQFEPLLAWYFYNLLLFWYFMFWFFLCQKYIASPILEPWNFNKNWVLNVDWIWIFIWLWFNSHFRYMYSSIYHNGVVRRRSSPSKILVTCLIIGLTSVLTIYKGAMFFLKFLVPLNVAIFVYLPLVWHLSSIWRDHAYTWYDEIIFINKSN